MGIIVISEIIGISRVNYTTTNIRQIKRYIFPTAFSQVYL